MKPLVKTLNGKGIFFGNLTDPELKISSSLKQQLVNFLDTDIFILIFHTINFESKKLKSRLNFDDSIAYSDRH